MSYLCSCVSIQQSKTKDEIKGRSLERFCALENEFVKANQKDGPRKSGIGVILPELYVLFNRNISVT